MFTLTFFYMNNFISFQRIENNEEWAISVQVHDEIGPIEEELSQVKE